MHIPEDILIAAQSLYDRLGQGSRKDEQEIVKALLQERERCAQVASAWKPSSFQDEHFAAQSIADTIRR